MTTHRLKIEERFLEEKLKGNKLFEIIRDNDYKVGDMVEYEEPPIAGYIGPRHVFEITYITDYMQRDGYVVFGEKYIGTAD